MSISSNFDFVPFLFNWVKYWTAVDSLSQTWKYQLKSKKKIIITSFDGLTNRPNGSVTCICFVRSHESKAKQDGDGKRGHNKTKDLIGRTIAQHERFNKMLYIYSRPLQNNLTWGHQNLRGPRTKTTAVNNLSCYLELDVMAELIYMAP